tara:strand:+ start:1976 stop:2326 length:351 start_codon:yes stop_codon:yes gene_type:complete
VNGEYKTSSPNEEQRREFVLDFIKQKDLIKIEDNLIRSEKVFVVNAVLKWCYEKAHTKKMTPTLWAKYKKMIAQYIAGIIDIQWTDNDFNIIEVINDDTKPRTTGTTGTTRKRKRK